MHLDDELIQRTLHGELGPSRKDAVDRHLAECAACRSRLEQARREEEWVFGLLRQADRPPPDLDAVTVARHAREAGAAVWGRWAAGFLLGAVFAGAAYTAPGSPVARWVEQVAGWVAGLAPPAPAPGPETPSGSVTAGIAVDAGERLAIHFAAPQSEGVVAVTLTEGSSVSVRVLEGTATFATDVDRLTIENSGSTADYEIELPRGAPWVEIGVGERRLFLKQGERVVTDATAGARGRYLLPLSPAP